MLERTAPMRQLLLLRITNVPDKLFCAEVHALVLPHREDEKGYEKRPSVNLPDHHAIDRYMKTRYSECVFLFPSIITTRVHSMALTLLFGDLYR